MRVLVITNKTKDKINQSVLNLFCAVKQLETTCDVLIVGDQLDEAIDYIGRYKIVNTIISLDDPNLKTIIVDNIAKQLAEIIKSYTHVMVANDDFGKSLLPRIAGILNCGQLSEVTKIISPNIYQKFIYTGNVLIEVELLEDIKLLSIKCATFKQYIELNNSQPIIQHLEYDQTQISNKIKHLNTEYTKNTVDLTHAKIIVSGGRSLINKENFESHIRKLANVLKAGVGATRAAVEEGLTTNDCQIGQTGKTVAPDVYLACGVSGAPQHIMGMKNSKVVIAINTDQTAPIFEYADYGIIADLFDVIPKLIDRFEVATKP